MRTRTLRCAVVSVAALAVSDGSQPEGCLDRANAAPFVRPERGGMKGLKHLFLVMLTIGLGEEDRMNGRFISIVAAFAAGLVLVAPSPAAPPAGASVALEHQATLVTPTQIVVRGVAECPAGVSGFVQVGVSQQKAVGPNTTAFGGTSVTCTGAKQSFSVIVNAFSGTWSPGSAFANAELFTGLGQNVENSRVIAIS